MALCLVTNPTFATTMGASAGQIRSAKKIAADQNALRAPQVIEQGDTTLGFRGYQGVNFDDNPLIGGTISHVFRPNFSMGATIAFANYGATMSVGQMDTKVDMSVITGALYGAYHADVFGVKNLDTFVSMGIGRNFISARTRSNVKGADTNIPSADIVANGNFFTAYVNARYFIDSRWSFVTSLGTGISRWSMGVDYLF